MKKLLALGAVLALGASVSVAQAQEKKSYITLDYGLVAASGGKTETQDLSSTGVTVTSKTEYEEPGDYLRLGYGRHLSDSLSVEVAYIDIAGLNSTQTLTIKADPEYSDLVNDSTTVREGGVATFSAFEGSAVYYKPLGEKNKLTFRGGLASYSWSSATGEALVETGDSVHGGVTPFFGIGAEFGNIHVEFQQYDFTLTDEEGTNLYGGPGILSAGYKIRF